MHPQKIMSQQDLETYCDQWLAAWTGNNPEKLLEFYAEDAFYRDPYLKEGITGHGALLTYFKKLLALNPAWVWTRSEIWFIDGGFALKWVANIPLPNGEMLEETGLDIILLKDRKITRNGVYFDRTEWMKALL